MKHAAAALLVLAAGAATAQDVVLSGRMGERALLMIDGQPYTAAVGQTVAGVKLRGWAGDQAQIEHRGKTVTLSMGATPVRLGAGAARSGGEGREIVLTAGPGGHGRGAHAERDGLAAVFDLGLIAGPGGHFSTAGTINGKQVRFLVDTGATMVSIGKDDAERLGLDLSNARRGATQTANGPVMVAQITLSSVRVGDVELSNVGAVVLPQSLPVVLLGNSFLSRLQMKRENDVMRLELR
jgi:aspartyl protease family protein